VGDVGEAVIDSSDFRRRHHPDRHGVIEDASGTHHPTPRSRRLGNGMVATGGIAPAIAQ
jgi:hypothetical protein